MPDMQAQKPILSDLKAQPRFKDLAVFEVDFDSQKDALRRLNVQQQSTLIVYKGGKEVARSTGETSKAAIEGLLPRHSEELAMISTIGLALLAGVLSVLSPCVLPLVPIVLGTAASEHTASVPSLSLEDWRCRSQLSACSSRPSASRWGLMPDCSEQRRGAASRWDRHGAIGAGSASQARRRCRPRRDLDRRAFRRLLHNGPVGSVRCRAAARRRLEPLRRPDARRGLGPRCTR